jgi:hypothetical protein
MKRTKPTESERSLTAPKPLPEGTKTYHRLGVVQYVKVSHSGDTLTPDLMRSILGRLTPQGRIQKLENSALKLENQQINDELDFVKVLLADGSLRALGKKDPLQHALNALERLVAIAETEQYVKPVVIGNGTIRANSKRASLPRPKWITEEKSFFDLVAEIATSATGIEESAKELWPNLLGQLDYLGASPTEMSHPSDLKKTKVEFTLTSGKRTSVAFGSFEEMVTKAKKSD